MKSADLPAHTLAVTTCHPHTVDVIGTCPISQARVHHRFFERHLHDITTRCDTDSAATASVDPIFRRAGHGVLVLGVIASFIALGIGKNADGRDNGLTAMLGTIGDSNVSLLKTAVIPLVFHYDCLARLAGQTLLWFAVTALIAVSIAIVLGVRIHPGSHANAGERESGDPSTVRS